MYLKKISRGLIVPFFI